MNKVICKSSAAIDPDWVKTYRAPNGSVMQMDDEIWRWSMAGWDRIWANGEREILEFKPGFGPTGPIIVGECAREPTPREVPVAFYPITVTQTLTGNMPRVGEKPNDWIKFLPGMWKGNPQSINRPGCNGYTLGAGTVFLSADHENNVSVRRMVDPSDRETPSTHVLCGSVRWASSTCRVIRNADGTWAPGFGPDGPVDAATMARDLIASGQYQVLTDKDVDHAELAGSVVRGLFKTMNEFCERPVVALTCIAPKGSSTRCSGEIAIRPYGKQEEKYAMCEGHYLNDELATSMRAHRVYPHGLNGLPGDPNPYWSPRLAKLPDPPRGDSHRTLEHLEPRWKTPAYAPPGRWRR